MDSHQRALRIPCPICRAAIGKPCHPAAHPDQAVAPHLARVDAALPLGDSDYPWDLSRMAQAQYRYLIDLDKPRTSERKRAWLREMIDLFDAEFARRMRP